MVTISKIQQPYIIPYQKNHTACDRIIKEYGKKKTQKLKAMVVEMYKNIIKDIADNAAIKYGVSANDFAQELYLRLLENLDYFAKQENPSSALTKYLRQAQTDEDDIISKADILCEELSPEKEAEYLSYTIDGQLTLPGIYKEVINRAKKLAKDQDGLPNDRELHIFTEWLNDKSLEEIAETLGLTRERVRQIKEKLLRKVRHSEPPLIYLYYDDDKKGLPVTHPDPPAHLRPKVEQESVDIDMYALLKDGTGADKIRKLTLCDYKQPNYWNTLNMLIRTQWSYPGFPRILFDRKTQEDFKKYNEENPGYKIKIRIPYNINKEVFISEAEKISHDIFGKNIFEFN